MKHAMNTITLLKQLSWLTFSLLLLMFVPKSFATSISINELGKYNIDFKKITTVTTVSSTPLIAQVTEKPGENFSMFLPFNVQQVNTIITNGQEVIKNQKIAYLKGYDVHHFLDEFAAAKQLFSIANKQYQSSLTLYNKKALQQSQWINVSNNYFKAKLRFEHLQHYMSFLHIDENEQIAIIAPITGIIRYASANDNGAKTEGDLLFDIIPNNAIRLKVNIPTQNIENLTFLQISKQQCKIAVSSKDNIINNFLVTVWSEPLNKLCPLSLGEKTIVTPIYQKDAFAIDKTAVFEFKNNNYIAVKQEDKLKLVTIEILGSTNKNFIFHSDHTLTGQVALTSSVSAVQGILLNLGSE